MNRSRRRSFPCPISRATCGNCEVRGAASCCSTSGRRRRRFAATAETSSSAPVCACCEPCGDSGGQRRRAGDAQKARSFAAQERFSFPVLFATEDVAGIYNIIYRYLFDRRRDLAIPTSFLLDQGGHDRQGVPGADRSATPAGRCEVRAGHSGRAQAKGASVRRSGSTRARFSAMTSPMGSRCSSMAIWSRQRSPFNRSSPPSRMIRKAITTWARST